MHWIGNGYIEKRGYRFDDFLNKAVMVIESRVKEGNLEGIGEEITGLMSGSKLFKDDSYNGRFYLDDSEIKKILRGTEYRKMLKDDEKTILYTLESLIIELEEKESQIKQLEKKAVLTSLIAILNEVKRIVEVRNKSYEVIMEFMDMVKDFEDYRVGYMATIKDIFLATQKELTQIYSKVADVINEVKAKEVLTESDLNKINIIIKEIEIPSEVKQIKSKIEDTEALTSNK